MKLVYDVVPMGAVRMTGRGKWIAVLNHHVSSMVEDLQVIGNVYENQELLKGDKFNLSRGD